MYKNDSNLYSKLNKILIKCFRISKIFKRESQQNPQDLESGGSADRLGTNFFGLLIQK